MAKRKNIHNNNKLKIDAFQQTGNWKKVKIAGNLVSDNGGGGLEGLIGLEVLENYNVMKVGNKNNKRKLKTVESDEESEKSFDDEFIDDQLNKNSTKKESSSKKKKLIPKNKLHNNNNIPGRYVLLKPSVENNKTLPKEMNPGEHPNDNVDDSETAVDQQLIIDDMIEWNGLGVPTEVLQALADKHFTEPTEIQRLTLPSAIMGRKDILGAAETGSGKTLAFGIPIINGILQMKRGIIKNIRSNKSNLISPITSPTTMITKIDVKKPSNTERDNLTPPPEEIDNFPIEELDTESDNERGGNDEGDNELNVNPLYALILTPTRELAVQIKDHLCVIAKYTDIKIAAVFGGLATVKQERVLKKCPEIVVATPGRLWELLQDGNQHLNKLENISFLVIDETDRMLEKGHFDELKLLLNRLNGNVGKRVSRQNFVFSATLTLVYDLPNYVKKKFKSHNNQTMIDKKLQSLIEHLGMEQPKIVDITKKYGTQNVTKTAHGLTECRIMCEHTQKDLYLYYFVQRHPGRTIVFCNSIDCVRRLAQLFGILQCEPRPLHSHMNQRQRLKNLERFTKSSTGLLIATDVAARGLDIPNVEHVIHYQVPRTSENYVHRSGRTARAKTEGIAVLIVDPTEAKLFTKLCKTLQKDNDEIPLFPISQNYIRSIKERVNLARDIDVLELKLRREQNQVGWLKKTATEMDIIIDDTRNFNVDANEDEYSDDEMDGMPQKSRDKKLLQNKRIQLEKLIAKPVFPKGFSYKYPTSTGKLRMPSDMNDDDEDITTNRNTDYNNAISLMKHQKEQSKK